VGGGPKRREEKGQKKGEKPERGKSSQFWLTVSIGIKGAPGSKMSSFWGGGARLRREKKEGLEKEI